MSRLEISCEGNSVTLTIGASKTKVDDERYLRVLQTGGLNLGLLPPGVRWISADGDQMIVEEPPTRRLVHLRAERDEDCCYCDDCDDDYDVCDYCENGEASDSDKFEDHCIGDSGWATYSLPIPWTVYVLAREGTRMRVTHVFVRKGPLKGPRSMLGMLPLPNIYGDGHICTADAGTVATFDTYSNVNFAVDEFWSSAFNSDVMDYIENGAFRQFVAKARETGKAGPFEYWESVTTPEAEQWYAARISDQPATLGTLIQRLEAEKSRNIFPSSRLLRHFYPTWEVLSVLRVEP